MNPFASPPEDPQIERQDKRSAFNSLDVLVLLCWFVFGAEFGAMAVIVIQDVLKHL